MIIFKKIISMFLIILITSCGLNGCTSGEDNDISSKPILDSSDFDESVLSDSNNSDIEHSNKNNIPSPMTIKDQIVGYWSLESNNSGNSSIIFYEDGTCFVNYEEEADWQIVDNLLYLTGGWGGKFYDNGKPIKGGTINIENDKLFISEDKTYQYKRVVARKYMNCSDLKKSLIGKWTLTSGSHRNRSIVFFENGTCYINNSESGVWKILDGYLAVWGGYSGQFWSNGDQMLGNITIDNKTMTINEITKGTSKKLTYTKQ